ncbi:MAG: TonB-dependent receptor [Piscinibacter sp.]|uniref:TonB-dependent receptor family protein n=1 Tax=Piscinibacter sp. TaxID=1903157 RepID=UPI002585122F|nr:TonB-dependent receptor [Piscinibacter sp.]MCW5662385.1 TonB-dependent receptor [Piscinibacter sp.]
MIRRSLLSAALAAAFPAVAQVTLDPVVISAERTRQTTFEAPAAISAVTREVIDGGMQVNLSEVLNRVPGISILNRQNYAQDLQLSIRGFGARSTFGIRGVRLIVDGIPATMPDGQGQASSIALSSAQRIEVLRGPLAQLYGNAAGGVVQVFTGPDGEGAMATGSAAVGSFGQQRLGARFSYGGSENDVVLDASRFTTDGWRQHAAAERNQINAKWGRRFDAQSRFSLVANVLDQPFSQDPIGLRREQWQADPRQADSAALDQDAGKVVAQRQIGAVYERALSDATLLTTRLYFGSRELDNRLSTPLGPQFSNTSSGGIVHFERGYAGLGVQVEHRIRLGEQRQLRLTGGVEFDRMNEDRQGYINDGGTQGALKRDEHNSVHNSDLYGQAAFDLTDTLSLSAGARASRVRFHTDDLFVRPAPSPDQRDNGDDSGSLKFSATNPVAGLSWRPVPSLNLYANVGRGFETPTFTELSYRPACGTPAPVGCVETGLNTDLKASRSRHAEIGAKWKIADGQRLDAALFDIATRDEIIVDTNSGGRTTFKNAGRTSRRGAELSYLGRYGPAWRATLALTALRARFDETFVSGSGPSATTIPAGNRLPGTPERSAFAELAWTPPGAWGGFNAGVELVHTGKLYVNDANSDAAPAATVLNLRAGFAQQVEGWTFSQLLRVDNATDRNYAGSVIVNEGQARFFEPALPRNWLLAFTARHTFK